MKKNIFIILIVSIVTLTACKVDDKVKIDKKIDKLEQEGKIPKLDRSNSLIGKLTKNGIREDVEKWIIKKYPNQISEAMQEARVQQGVLTLNLEDEKALEIYRVNTLRAIECRFSRYDMSNLTKENPTQENPTVIALDLEKITFNTEQRLKIYIKYNLTMNGRSFPSYSSSEIVGEVCDD